MKLLIANPNMSQTMTALMVAEARATCRHGTEITGVTAGFGVPYIGTRSEMAIAGHALLELLAQQGPGHDAVVIGAFCHGFVAAAKELLSVPVVGLAEAGMRSAQIFGRRVGILGVGDPERGSNEDIIFDLDMRDEIAGIRLLSLPGHTIAEDQAAVEAEALRQGQTLVTEDKADVIVLGGAALAGLAGQIAPHLPVPLITPLPYAVALAEAAVLTAWKAPTAGAYKPPGPKPTSGLGPDLGKVFDG
ncbi:aspartate/glutamate racemase family protein [Primorskyibacter sp. 2E233]|uniref:aspartate/glutamate racemase family protein n=1 Tax=Primorskyibacter sp. 2E233 TaxID=3413431 RepID=UPI003BF404ED